MPLLYSQKKGSVQIAVWKIEETTDELWEQVDCSVKSSYETAVARFGSVQREREWLASRLLLSTVTGRPAHMAHTESGKPFLTDSTQHISLSHTKEYAAVAISDTQDIGVDIEQYSPRVQRVSKRFLHPQEQPLPFKGDLTWGLLLYWSAKESIYKCMEHPDADFRNILIHSFTPSEAGRFHAESLSEHTPCQFNISYVIGQNFVLTCAQSAD